MSSSSVSQYWGSWHHVLFCWRPGSSIGSYSSPSFNCLGAVIWAYHIVGEGPEVSCLQLCPSLLLFPGLTLSNWRLKTTKHGVVKYRQTRMSNSIFFIDYTFSAINNSINLSKPIPRVEKPAPIRAKPLHLAQSIIHFITGGQGSILIETK